MSTDERPMCSGNWISGSGGHREHEPCDKKATWCRLDMWSYCDEHIKEHDKTMLCHTGVAKAKEVRETDKEFRKLAKDVIIALLDCRDFLSYQLSYASKMMTQKEFDKACEKYLGKRDVHDTKELKKRISVLKKIIGKERIDIDSVSIMFNCSLGEAAAALKGRKNDLKTIKT